MSILKLVTVNGEPAELLAIYDREQPLIRERFPQGPRGFTVHVCAVAPEGLLHVNAWESPEHSDAWGLAMKPIYERVGMPPISSVTVYPIHNLVLPTSHSSHANADPSDAARYRR
jgi:hypothetical protein